MVFIMSTARATAASIKKKARIHFCTDSPAICDNLAGPGMRNPVQAFTHRGYIDIVVRIWRVDAGGGEDHVSRLTGTKSPTCAVASLSVAGRDGLHWFAITVPLASLHWKQSTLEPETCFIFEIWIGRMLTCWSDMITLLKPVPSQFGTAIVCFCSFSLIA